MAKSATIYQLKVTLRDIKPPIWRRLQVPADITLGKLHVVLQAALGWENAHLHQFLIGQQRIGPADLDDFDGELEDEERVKLSQVAAEKARIIYEYDFGDSWEHEIVVEKVLAAEPDGQYPVCLDGKRACPPEDCGGTPGYYDVLDALEQPSTERHAELLEWLGGNFDPERFDLESANAAIRPRRARRRSH